MFLNCNDVIFLEKGGKTVASTIFSSTDPPGSTKLVQSYFLELGFEYRAKTNPADFYLDIISGSIQPLLEDSKDQVDLVDTWQEKESQFSSPMMEEKRSQVSKRYLILIMLIEVENIPIFFGNWCGNIKIFVCLFLE